MPTDNPKEPLILVAEGDKSRAGVEKLSFQEARGEYWERIFDAVPELIAIIDPDHTITRVNKAMADRCGVAPENLVGRKCYEVVHGLSQPLAGCPHAKVLLDGQAHSAEIEEPRCNGVFDVTVSPLTAEEGRVIASVHIMRDVTSHKQAARLLAENEIRLRTLVQTIPDLVWLKDVDGVYLACNRMFERFFGAGEADIIGKTDYDFVDRELADFFREHDRKAMAAGEPSNNEEWITFADDGQQALLETIKTPMRDSNGRLIGVLGIARDITERKQAEENSLEMERKYQQTQKLESLGVLAGGVAHDFNNILTIILGHCYVLEEELESGISGKDHVQQIEAAATRAAELCHQMLAYAGQSPQVKVWVNLWMLVDDVVKMLSSAIKKNVTIEHDISRDVLVITGDNAQIQQVVMNLIINAAEAIGDKNGTIRVVLGKKIVIEEQDESDFLGNAIQPGRYACLEVSDTGCGIDEETRKRIFEPFFTTKFTGRGLGMSAVLGIIKSHGGVLQLASTPGVGTTFKVYFPLPDETYTVEAVPAYEKTPLAKVSGTILLVDDEVEIRAIDSILLNTMGFSVITALNGREALDIFSLHESEIDSVLLDLIMPEMGGLETYRFLRAVSPDVPIVFCSGYDIEAISAVVETDDHAEVVKKPFKPDQLREVLLKVMGHGSN
ncbi:MAG: PAS domain-containing protein [Pelobacteraceae bacterium]